MFLKSIMEKEKKDMCSIYGFRPAIKRISLIVVAFNVFSFIDALSLDHFFRCGDELIIKYFLK